MSRQSATGATGCVAAVSASLLCLVFLFGAGCPPPRLLGDLLGPLQPSQFIAAIDGDETNSEGDSLEAVGAAFDRLISDPTAAREAVPELDRAIAAALEAGIGDDEILLTAYARLDSPEKIEAFQQANRAVAGQIVGAEQKTGRSRTTRYPIVLTG